MKEQEGADKVRFRWGIPSDVPLLVHVGRLAKQKNQRFILELMPRLTGIHCALIGDGELNGELKALAVRLAVYDQVHFIGEVASQDAYSIASAGNVFLFPSLWEAMPLAMIEAMLLGIPIIANDIPSTREFLGGDGVLINVKDPDEWVSSIHLLLKRRDIAIDYIKRAKQRAQNYGVKEMADSYEQLFASESI